MLSFSVGIWGIMIVRRLVLGLAATLAFTAAFAGTASAQQWPTHPVKLIVTFPPGGASDAAARIIAGPLSEKLGQTVIIDNKPGGGTTIGANIVLAAKDDFHTLMLSNSAPISIAPYLFDKPPYDPIKDFATSPISARWPTPSSCGPPCRPRTWPI